MPIHATILNRQTVLGQEAPRDVRGAVFGLAGVCASLGILFTTVITLFLVPCALLFAQDVADAAFRRGPSLASARVAVTNRTTLQEPNPSPLP